VFNGAPSLRERVRIGALCQDRQDAPGFLRPLPVEYAKIMSASRDIGLLVSTADKIEEGAMLYRFYDYNPR